jgi:hypothetical protein
MFSEQKPEETKVTPWFFMRLRIYDSYLSIGCGGSNEAAQPVLQEFVDQINHVGTPTGHLLEPCRLQESGSHFDILNLNEFADQAGKMLVEKLLHSGWEIYKSGFEDGQKITLIDMHKRRR